MSVYRLHYFNMRGRAELARWLFAVSGTEYEDVRIEKEDWPALKASMTFGQIPVLEVKDGEQVTFLSQSFAICRYLARKFNLDGKDELEKAKVDMIVEQYLDLQNGFIKAHFEQDETKKKELNEKLVKEIIPQNLQFFEKILSENKTNSGWYVGESYTLADLVAFHMWEWVRDRIGSAFDSFPLVKENDQKVKNISQLAEWLAKRPVTDM